MWLQKDEFPSNKLFINDLDNDGTNELIEAGKQIRNGKGEVIKEIKSGDSQDAVLFFENEDKSKTLQFCDFFESKLRCEDSEKNKILEADAPLSSVRLKNPRKVKVPFDEYSFIDDSEDIAFPKAFWVRLKEKEPKYLAIIGAYIGLPRANFYVYRPDGELVYHELLSEEAETISVLPADNETEDILIGGKDTIWKFTAK